MFMRIDSQEVCRGDFCFVPRVVAYRDVFGNQPVVQEHGYWTALRVVNYGIVNEREFSYDQEDQILRDSLAAGFLRRTLETLRADSVSLHLLPGREVVTASLDASKFSPRDIHFLTFNFGKLQIPPTTQSCKAVFHLTFMDPAGNSSRSDSVEFTMDRVERHHRSQLVTAGEEEDLRGF